PSPPPAPCCRRPVRPFCQLYTQAPMPRPLTVMETFRSLFYAPQFVELHGGHFAAEDLEVHVRTAGGGATATNALLGGRIPIGLGGLMRSFELADRGGGILVHFAGVN